MVIFSDDLNLLCENSSTITVKNPNDAGKLSTFNCQE